MIKWITARQIQVALFPIDFTEKSDVDFLVEFNYKDKSDDNNLFERVENTDTLKQELMEITNRQIDLIEEGNIRNKFLRYFINKEKKLIYGLSWCFRVARRHFDGHWKN